MPRSTDALLRRKNNRRQSIDLDSTEDPAHGKQDGVASNGHFAKNCCHPLFSFTNEGDCLGVRLRPGKVHSAAGALEFIRPMQLRRAGLGVDWHQGLSGTEVWGYLREFYDYSHPLFLYALVGLLTGSLDRWLLQIFGGSVEQGFHGLSYHIGVLGFLCTSAMTPLLTREFAIAFGARDLAQMARRFRGYIPLLYGWPHILLVSWRCKRIK